MKKFYLLFCCTYLIAMVALAQNSCREKLGTLPSVHFPKTSIRLNDEAKTILSTLAAKMRMNSDCKIVVIGYSSKKKQNIQMSWNRVNTVITHYLIEIEGIDSKRFIFKFAQKGDDPN